MNTNKIKDEILKEIGSKWLNTNEIIDLAELKFRADERERAIELVDKFIRKNVNNWNLSDLVTFHLKEWEELKQELRK